MANGRAVVWYSSQQVALEPAFPGVQLDRRKGDHSETKTSLCPSAVLKGGRYCGLKGPCALISRTTGNEPKETNSGCSTTTGISYAKLDRPPGGSGHRPDFRDGEHNSNRAVSSNSECFVFSSRTAAPSSWSFSGEFTSQARSRCKLMIGIVSPDGILPLNPTGSGLQYCPLA